MNAQPATRNFELVIRRGVAHDIGGLRALTEPHLSLRDAIKDVSWQNEKGADIAPMMLSNYENAKRSISLSRYLDLLRLYFSRLPKSTAENHPAFPLLRDKGVPFGLSSTSEPLQLYQYLAWIHALVLAERLPATDPAEKLYQYIWRLGNAGRAL